MDTFNELPRKSEMKKSRRSSFFQRRLSTVITDFCSPLSSPGSSTEEHDYQKKIKDFLGCLDEENLDWKNLLAKLQKEQNTFSAKSSQTLDHDSSCWKQLTEEDKAFLEDRTDLSKVGRLLDSTVEALVLRERRINCTNKRVANLMEDCEETNKEVTERFIDDFMNNFSELDLKSGK